MIGAEDLLEINVFELPQFNVTSRVSGDGTITMPLIGSVQVRGLTKKEVEKQIEAALAAKYINNPSVSVTIKEYKSRQVSILGAVNTPGAYTIISSRTLLQLLSEAGGCNGRWQQNPAAHRVSAPAPAELSSWKPHFRTAPAGNH